MSSKIFKNYQVNVGVPFQVRVPLNFQTIKAADAVEHSIHNDDYNDKITEDAGGEIEKAREEAELILKEAQLEALRIMENTEREIEVNKLAIEEEARRIGYENGFSEAKKQYEDLIQEAEFIREHARAEYREVLESIESDAINVILEIAKKVIGIEISFNKEDILYLVKQAFEKCGNKENIVLKTSPEDYDFLVINKDKLLSMVEGIGDLEIKKDSSLKEGACIVETAFGSVDAGVQTKLNKIEQVFRCLIGK